MPRAPRENSNYQARWRLTRRRWRPSSPFCRSRWRWFSFIYNCSKPEESYAVQDPKSSREEELLHEVKELECKFIASKDFFEPTFKLIDAAVFGEKKVYVNCLAGKCRSTSLIAAYLVKRIGISTSDAYRFLYLQRNISDSWHDCVACYEEFLSIG